MKIPIKIDNYLRVDIKDIPDDLINKIKKELTIINPEWLQKKKMGKYNKHLPEKIHFYDEYRNKLIVPRGFIKQLITILIPYSPEYLPQDNTRLLDNIEINLSPQPKDEKWNFQDEVIDNIMGEPFAVINFPTGGGKTITAAKIICKRKQPALVIVHTKELLYQWKKKLLKFTDLEEIDIGLIGDGKNTFSPDKKITIGIINSLYKRVKEIKSYIGFLIVDEVHRLPGRCFREIVGEMDCYYILGLSATPKRTDSQTKVIFFYCGDVEYEVKPPALMKKGIILKPELIARETDFNSSLDPESDNYRVDLIGELVLNTERNELIINDIAKEFKKNNFLLVVSDRKIHCQILKTNSIYKISSRNEIALLTADTPNKERKEIVEKMQNGEIRIVVATTQLIGEGFDCPRLTHLFLTVPISSEGRLIQCAGRILRASKGKKRAVMYDYIDNKVPILRKSFTKRKKGYRKLGIII